MAEVGVGVIDEGGPPGLRVIRSDGMCWGVYRRKSDDGALVVVVVVVLVLLLLLLLFLLLFCGREGEGATDGGGVS